MKLRVRAVEGNGGNKTPCRSTDDEQLVHRIFRVMMATVAATVRRRRSLVPLMDSESDQRKWRSQVGSGAMEGASQCRICDLT